MTAEVRRPATRAYYRSKLTILRAELAMSQRLVHESVLVRTRVQWFTTLVGIRDNVARLKQILGELASPPAVVRTTEVHTPHISCPVIATPPLTPSQLAQGTSHRWAIGWSWN